MATTVQCEELRENFEYIQVFKSIRLIVIIYIYKYTMIITN